jgi:2-polyprenyl-6-methoxyphenol hydroxylase-like FAD-dependent oxidoreductase
MAYDVIVVGARCGGSPTAMLLARRGYRVLLVDRVSVPSDLRLSTHLVWQTGASRLARWGLLDAVRDSGCPPLSTVKLDFGPVTLVGTPPPYDGIAEAFAPRRQVLDGILVDAAVAAGVELRDRCAVEGLRWDGDRVVGVTCRSEGSSFFEDASLVIGADGMHSRVARLVDAPEYNTQPPLEGTYFSYWSGVPIDGIEVYLREGRACYGWATNEGLSLVGVNWVSSDYAAVRHGDIDNEFYAVVNAVAPVLADKLRAGTRVDHWIGTTVRGFYRRPFGSGWALVGDAGYNKDPGTAQGISDAFRDAQLLADAVDAGFSRRCPMNDCLAEYESTRNGASGALYAFTNQLATLGSPDEQMQQLLAALVLNTEQANRFIGVLAGTVAVEDFFSPENVSSIFPT